MSVPTVFYLYGLDRDPYDNRYRYFMMGPENEKYVFRAFFKSTLEEKQEKGLLKTGSDIHLLLNDILQHILEK